MEEVKAVQDLFMWFILFWGIVLIGLFAIGGFFMFRKFLKALPKEDGKSTLDWEEHFVNESLHLWNDEAKAMLNELVTPVPELFRDVAKQKIGSKIGEIALEDDAKTIEFDHIIKGYILATPKRDHNFLRKKLKEMEIDVQPYEHFFQMKQKVEVED